MVGIVISSVMNEAVRQVRAIYPRASAQEVTADLVDIASVAHEEARRQFPTNPEEQERFVGVQVSAAIRRALGSLKNSLTIH